MLPRKRPWKQLPDVSPILLETLLIILLALFVTICAASALTVPANLNCSFENFKACSWHQQKPPKGDDLQMLVIEGPGSISRHSTDRSPGDSVPAEDSYLAVLGTEKTKAGHKAWLISEPIVCPSPNGLSFLHWSTSSSVLFTVCLRQPPYANDTLECIAADSGAKGDGWIHAKAVAIPASSSPFEIIIEVSGLVGTEVAGIDNITIESNGATCTILVAPAKRPTSSANHIYNPPTPSNKQLQSAAKVTSPAREALFLSRREPKLFLPAVVNLDMDTANGDSVNPMNMQSQMKASPSIGGGGKISAPDGLSNFGICLKSFCQFDSPCLWNLNSTLGTRVFRLTIGGKGSAATGVKLPFSNGYAYSGPESGVYVMETPLIDVETPSQLRFVYWMNSPVGGIFICVDTVFTCSLILKEPHESWLAASVAVPQGKHKLIIMADHTAPSEYVTGIDDVQLLDSTGTFPVGCR